MTEINFPFTNVHNETTARNVDGYALRRATIPGGDGGFPWQFAFLSLGREIKPRYIHVKQVIMQTAVMRFVVNL